MTHFGVNSAKAVMLGNYVVIAGGNADGNNVQQVTFYHPDKGWGLLGKYKHTLFAMAVLEERLLLIGGYNLTVDKYSNELVEWVNIGRLWRPVFKPMPTARSDAAALGYDQYLLVAGGSNGGEQLTVFEVLDTNVEEWTTLAPLPVPIEGLTQSTTYVNSNHPHLDTWYLMGWEKGLLNPPSVFSVSLEQLVQQAKEGTQAAIWAQLPNPPLACCGVVAFQGCLLAVGGKDKKAAKRKDIYLYLPGTCEWLHVADLPTPRHSSCCFSPSSKEFLVIGGCEDVEFSTRVDTAHITS